MLSCAKLLYICTISSKIVWFVKLPSQNQLEWSVQQKQQGELITWKPGGITCQLVTQQGSSVQNILTQEQSPKWSDYKEQMVSGVVAHIYNSLIWEAKREDCESQAGLKKVVAEWY